MASVAFHGSATPSPFASTPQRIHVEGRNCIQPMAPAELGPMLRPKFDSILLIAASTCHGTSYWAPACCQSARSCAYGSGPSVVVSGASVVTSGVGTTVNVSARAPPARAQARTARTRSAPRFTSTRRDDAQAGVVRLRLLELGHRRRL